MGDLGEEIALIFLKNKGFFLVEKNYEKKPYGEIDLVVKKDNKIYRVRSNIKKSVKAELDLRGMRYDEAEISLDKYIDDCLVTNMPFATIIHGYGTLTLRKLVKTYVDKNSHIKSHRDGEGGEGGTGVTVVNFK